MQAKSATTTALIIAVVLTVVLSLIICHIFMRNVDALLNAFRSIGDGTDLHRYALFTHCFHKLCSQNQISTKVLGERVCRDARSKFVPSCSGAVADMRYRNSL